MTRLSLNCVCLKSLRRLFKEGVEFSQYLLCWGKKVKFMTENQEQVLKRLKELYYNLGTALRFHNPYELLVATILSAQATDKQVNKVNEGAFSKYPDATRSRRLLRRNGGRNQKYRFIQKQKQKYRRRKQNIGRKICRRDTGRSR